MTERYVDLHTHSCVSDGSMKPAEVVRAAKDAGLAAMALTDHDEVAGIPEAAAEGERLGIEVVPGIELSAQGKTEVHVLGFYPDVESRPFQDALARIRDCRHQRMVRTSELCRENGMDISMEEAESFANGGLLCRAHFARAMVARGWADSVKDAFDRWLGNGKPCHFDMQVFSPDEAVRLLKDANAVVCIAHLNQLHLPDEEVYAFLKSLLPCGLDGIEGWYTEYSTEQTHTYQEMARELGLICSGGSDFHGTMKPHISIGRGTGALRIPYQALENVKSRRKAR